MHRPVLEINLINAQIMLTLLDLSKSTLGQFTPYVFKNRNRERLSRQLEMKN